MTRPRLINNIPKIFKASGGESLTICGKDIDSAATVDLRLQPLNTLIPCVVTQFINFPDNLQHITVTTPAVPPQSGIPGDITYFERHVTIRVTNPPYGEWDELEQAYHARFLDNTPTFTEIGHVLFYPERLTSPASGGALFESFTAGSDLWRQTYEFIPDAGGTVDYKAYSPYDQRPFDPRHNKRTSNWGRPRTYSPFITRGEIKRVILETFPGFPGGWSVTLRDDTGFDAFQGNGIGAGPPPGSAVEFVPVLVDGYGTSHPVVLHDHMRFTITGAGAGAPPSTYGLVHIYLGLD